MDNGRYIIWEVIYLYVSIVQYLIISVIMNKNKIKDVIIVNAECHNGRFLPKCWYLMTGLDLANSGKSTFQTIKIKR